MRARLFVLVSMACNAPRAVPETAPGGGRVVVLAGAEEPGARLVVEGGVFDEAGRPVGGARVRVHQTDARGLYAERDGDPPRLAGEVESGADGRFELRTIRPGPYPGGGPPAHIHVEIVREGYATLTTEIQFDDDPRLTPEMRQNAEAQGFVVVRPEQEGSLARARARFLLRRR